MTQIVPIQALPNQQVQVQLDGQACTINIFQQAFGLYFDLYVGAAAIVQGSIGQNLNRLVRLPYLGFTGDFVFWDTQGTEDPVFTGLGARWQLIYLSAADVAIVEGS